MERRYILFYSCSKGDTCQFRHEPAALTNETVSARSWRVKRWKEQSSKKCLASWGDHDHERRARDKEREKGERMGRKVKKVDERRGRRRWEGRGGKKERERGKGQQIVTLVFKFPQLKVLKVCTYWLAGECNKAHCIFRHLEDKRGRWVPRQKVDLPWWPCHLLLQEEKCDQVLLGDSATGLCKTSLPLPPPISQGEYFQD